MKRVAILVLTMAVTACGSSQPTGNTAVAEPTSPSEFQNQVVALPDAQRNGVMIRAIRDAGKDCQGVTRSERQPDMQGQPTYLATCQGGATYGVAFDRNGTAQVSGS